MWYLLLTGFVGFLRYCLGLNKLSKHSINSQLMLRLQLLEADSLLFWLSSSHFLDSSFTDSRSDAKNSIFSSYGFDIWRAPSVFNPCFCLISKSLVIVAERLGERRGVAFLTLAFFRWSTVFERFLVILKLMVAFLFFGVLYLPLELTSEVIIETLGPLIKDSSSVVSQRFRYMKLWKLFKLNSYRL